jgi:hypothetical protein
VRNECAGDENREAAPSVEECLSTGLAFGCVADQAAPSLEKWPAGGAPDPIPEEFATLRRLLEARMGKPGKREFVQVLRLMEAFRIDDVTAAVGDAIARGAIGFDAIKHLVLCRIERRPPRLDMAIYPYLPRATVTTTSARSYMELLAGAAS